MTSMELDALRMEIFREIMQIKAANLQQPIRKMKH